MWRVGSVLAVFLVLGVCASFLVPASETIAVSGQYSAYPYLSDSNTYPLSAVTTQTSVTASTPTIYTDKSVDARLVGMLLHIKWLLNEQSSTQTQQELERLNKQILSVMDDIGEDRSESREGGTLPDGFEVNDSGQVTAGTWQAGVIADTYISDALTLGASTTFAFDIITPDSVLTNGQVDEYCLTYETTGKTFEWETCGGGAGLTMTDIDTSLELETILTDETGSGAAVFATSPILTTPNLGTPSALTLTNATGLPVTTGISGLAAGVATFLGTPSSANLAAAITNETGSGNVVFSGSPTFTGAAIFANTGIQVGTSIPFSDSTGTLTLQNIDVIDTATEATIEGAIDTLANLTAASSLASVGTITAGTWQGTPIGDVYLTKTGDWTGTLDGIEGAAFALDSDIGTTIQGYNANTSFLGSTISANELASADFGDFTCNGTSCTLDVSYLVSTSIDTSAELAAILGDETGSGNVVFSASPTFTGTPVLPSSFTIGANTFARSGAFALTLTNTAATNVTLPTSGTLYGTAAGSISSANLLGSLSDETGTGRSVFSISPAFSGTPTFAALTASSTLTLSGTAANIALGSNYLSGDGGDEGLFVNSIGNVGIGTTTPIRKLTLFESANDSSAFSIETPGTQSNQTAQIDLVTKSNAFYLGASANNKGWQITARGDNFSVAADRNDLLFYYWNGSSFISSLAMDSLTGNVGIGNPNPSHMLSVGASAGSQFLVSSAGVISDGTWQGDVISSTYLDTVALLSTEIDTSSELASILTDETGFSSGALSVFSISPVISGTADFVSGDFSSTLTMSGSAANIALGSNYLSGDGGDEGIYVSSIGNVGIGTTTPGQKLVVDGSINTLGSFVSITSGITTVLSANGGGSYLEAQGANNLQFFTGGTQRLHINSGGNIGIGTTSPMAKLSTVLTSTNTTGGNEYGSYINVTDTGIVAAGNDTTYGQRIGVTHTGQTTNGLVNTYGQYITAFSDAIYNGRYVTGQYVSAGGGSSDNIGLYLEVEGGTTPSRLTGIKSDIGNNTYNASSVTGIEQYLRVDGTATGTDSYGQYQFIETNSISTTANTLYGNFTQIYDGSDVSSGTDYVYGDYINVDHNGFAGGTFRTYGEYIQVSGGTAGDGVATGLYIDASGSDKNYAAIFANGDVGIGTTSPMAKLSLNLASTNTTADYLYGQYTKVADTGVVTSTPGDSDTTYGNYLDFTRTGATGGSISSFGQFIKTLSDSAGTGNAAHFAQYIDVTSSADNIWGGYTNVNSSGGQSIGHEINIADSSTTGNNTYGTLITLTDNANFTTPNDMYGIYAAVNKNNNASADSTMYGSYNSVYNSGGSGINSSIGVYSTVSGDVDGTSMAYAFYADAGNADNNYLFYADVGAAAGTTLYGTYIDVGGGAGTEYSGIFTGGNFGIGDITPDSMLDVETTGVGYIAQFTDGTRDLRFFTSSGYGALGSERVGDDLRLYVDGNATRGLTVQNGTGNIGIGTSTPAQKLQVFGNIRVGTSGSNGCIENYAGGVIGGTCSSDQNLKTNIESLAEEGRSYIEGLAALTPVSYNWNQAAVELYRKDKNAVNLGLIAQDVESQFPELVSENEDGYKQVDFGALPFYIIEALKELWTKVQGQDERLLELEQENEYLKDRIENIEDELNLDAPAPPPEPEPEPIPEVPPEETPTPEVPTEPTPEEVVEELEEEPTYTLVPMAQP